MLKRETARLNAIFGRALLVSAASGGALAAPACSNTGATQAGSGDAGGDDSTTRTDAADDRASSDVEDVSPWPRGCAPPPPVAYDAGADAPNCAYRVTLPCGVPSFVTNIYPPNCAMSPSECIEVCTGAAFPFLQCEVADGLGCDYDAQAFVAPDGAPIVVECDKCAVGGRRPAGLEPARCETGNVLGRFFAQLAHLEAASVGAFTTLGQELRELGAPAALVRAAQRSARDEVRHARAMARIARRHGGEPPPVRAARRRTRSLAAVAIENAVEGCVRETFGALVAAWQAEHARDERIARAMARIASDEIRHAALAWAIARWIELRLDARARRTLVSARRAATVALRREARGPVPPPLESLAGLPSASQAAHLLEVLERELWSRATSAIARPG
jgi:hypothetical protein